jgi:hypothetical protein
MGTPKKTLNLIKRRLSFKKMGSKEMWLTTSQIETTKLSRPNIRFVAPLGLLVKTKIASKMLKTIAIIKSVKLIEM